MVTAPKPLCSALTQRGSVSLQYPGCSEQEHPQQCTTVSPHPAVLPGASTALLTTRPPSPAPPHPLLGRVLSGTGAHRSPPTPHRCPFFN